jgi:hypothetical protein
MPNARTLAVLVGALFAGACATIPPGPTQQVLPGTGKTFDQFRVDDVACRDFATAQVGTPEQAQTDAAARSALAGAGVGAVAGALTGNSHTAAGGAALGLIVGAIAGSGPANASGRHVQYRYDVAYQQCMYSKGHRVPVAARYEHPGARGYAPPPPPPGSPPPPPPQGSSSVPTPPNVAPARGDRS